ncbi:PspC domain-containing protein [Candidatus Woesearchaeota archaeon]|nr:PspC domain-containing protein [Candidatus Woesearchaeota archaeon]
MEMLRVFFPLWIVWIIVFLILFVILAFVFWIWAIVDCLTSKLSAAQKIFWLIIILFLHFIGALAYFIFSKASSEVKMKSKNFKGKRLFRSKKNRVIAGVCGGIGEYLGIDPTVIRLLWILFTLLGGAGILAYIIAWIIVPEEK